MGSSDKTSHAAELVRFAGIGLFCFGLGLGILTALHELAGVHYLVAYAAAFACTSTLGYLLNSRYTFGAQSAGGTGLLRYTLVNLTLLILNGLALRLLVETFHVWYLGAALLLAAINTPVSFLAHRLVSYRLGFRTGTFRRWRMMRTPTIDPAQATPRTLVTVTHFFPAHGGGLEFVAEQLARRFADQGMAVEWFSSNTDPPPAPAANRAAVPIATTNIIERLTQLPYPLWSLTVIPALWKAIGRADIVHIHEHLYFGSIVSVTMARLRRRPIVITQHMGALTLGSKLSTTLYQLATRLLGRPIFAAATRAVFISANVRAFFRLETSAKTRLIFNGIDTDRFTPCTAAERRGARARLGYPEDRPIALFVGRFVRKKGLHIIEQLTQRFPELLWVFVGSGPESPARWDLDNVSVAGRVEHEKLSDFYQAADFLLLPSSGEGFPLVVQEALACGLGVLSTREVGAACPQARHLIRVPPATGAATEIREWEQAVRALLADDLYLEAREARARDAHELWSWDRCVFEYLRLFDEIAMDGRRA